MPSGARSIGLALVLLVWVAGGCVGSGRRADSKGVGNCRPTSVMQLAYSDGDEIVLVDTRARRLRRLTNPGPEWNDGDPAWSPDAKRLAFARYDAANPGGVGIFTVSADGGKPSLLQVGALDPTWSPRADALLVTRTNGHDFWAGIIGSDGKVRPIDLPPFDAGWAWSPDGRQLATESPDGLTITDAKGTNPETIWRGPAREPAWSPDGTRIAFGTAAGLRTVGEDGKDPKLIARARRATAPAWSPDGRRLAFGTVRSRRTAIEVTAADGTSHRVLAPDAGEATDSMRPPAWSPDGTWLAYESTTGQVLLVRHDGTDRRALPRIRGGFGTGFSWRPCASENG
jgi:Tol biopolymer transport system component